MKTSELVYLGISIVFLTIVINVAIYLASISQNVSSSYATSVQSTNASLQTAELNSYNGLQVTGSDVVSAVRKYTDEGLTVRVVTKIKSGTDNSTVTKKTTDYVRKLKINDVDGTTPENQQTDIAAIGDDNFISPAATFLGTTYTKIDLDDSDSTDCGYVTAIIFEQVDAVAVAAPMTPGGSTDSGNGGSGSGSNTGTGSGSTNATITGADQLVTAVDKMTTALQSLQSTLNSITASDGDTSDGSTQNIAITLAKLMSTVNSIDTKINNSDFTNLSTDIASLNSNTTALNTSIANLQTTINSSNSAISASDVAEIKSGISSLSTAVAQINIVDYSDTLNKIAAQVGVSGTSNSSSLSKRMDKIEEKLDKLLEYVGTPEMNSNGKPKNTLFDLVKGR